MLQQSEVTYLEEIEALKAQRAAEERERAMASLINKKPIAPASDNKIVNDKPKVVTEPSKVINDPSKSVPAKLVSDPAKVVKEPVKIVSEPPASNINKPAGTANILDQQQQSANRPMNNQRRQQIQMDDGIE